MLRRTPAARDLSHGGSSYPRNDRCRFADPLPALALLCPCLPLHRAYLISNAAAVMRSRCLRAVFLDTGATPLRRASHCWKFSPSGRAGCSVRHVLRLLGFPAIGATV